MGISNYSNAINKEGGLNAMNRWHFENCTSVNTYM